MLLKYITALAWIAVVVCLAKFIRLAWIGKPAGRWFIFAALVYYAWILARWVIQ